MSAPLPPQTVNVGDVFFEAFDTGLVEVGALTAAIALCALGPGAVARSLRFVFRRERGRAPLEAHQLESVGRTLLLAERTWLSLGLLALAIPWLGSIASLASVLRGETSAGTPGFPPSYAIPILFDVVLARLVLGGAGRAALARALERGAHPAATAVGRASDALLLAHLLVPPLWVPLLFHRFPG